MEAKTKGIGLVNMRRYILERYGLEGWVAVQAELSAEDRAEIDSVVLVGWYSLTLYSRALHAFDRVHGAGDPHFVAQFGRYQAERDLTTIHRAFLRMANPSFFLEKNGEYWRRYYNTGKWTIERLAPTRVRAYLDDWEHDDPALCRELVGYIGKAFELVGAKSTRFEHPHCRARGEGERCVFLGSWGADAR